MADDGGTDRQTPARESPAIDASMLEELRAAFPPAQLAALFAGMVQSVEQERADLAAALASGDRDTGAAHAHRLVSVTAQYGLPALAAAARSIEAALLAGEAVGTDALGRLDLEQERAMAAITRDRMLDGGSDSRR